MDTGHVLQMLKSFCCVSMCLCGFIHFDSFLFPLFLIRTRNQNKPNSFKKKSTTIITHIRWGCVRACVSRLQFKLQIYELAILFTIDLPVVWFVPQNLMKIQINVDKNRSVFFSRLWYYKVFEICSGFFSLAKIFTWRARFRYFFSLRLFNSTSTSPKRSVNKVNAMLNVLLFSSHYTTHTHSRLLQLLEK